MNNKLQRVFAQFMPFIVLGITIAFMIGLLVLFSYLLIWGLLIGAILWLVMVIKHFFSPKPPPKKTKGRVIEHEDKR